MTSVAARARLPVGSVPAGPAAAALAAVVASLAALVVATRGGGWDVPLGDDLLVDVAVGLSYPVVGAAVLSGRRGPRGLGRLLLAVGLAGALTALATAVAATATSATGPALFAAWLQGWLWVPAFAPLLTLLPLLYPDGRPPSPRWRPLVTAAAAGTVLATLAVALHPEDAVGRVVLERPITAAGPATLLGVSALVLLLPAVVAGPAALAVRLRRSRGLERRQVLVALAAAAVLLAEVLVHRALPEPVAAVAQPLAVVLLPVAVGVAVTRHRLYDLDVAVLRSLVGLSTATCLAGVFLTLFAAAQALVPGDTAVATAVAAGVTGLAVQPLGRRLSQAADRLYYGDRADPWRALAGLSGRLRDDVAVPDVPQAVCEAVLQALRLSAAELLLEGDRSAAAAGTPSGPPRDVVLAHRGEQVARLRVWLRQGEEELDPRDRAVLAALADQAAPAVASLRLYEQLRASREALVSSREEERLRLRRDLHDGVGAALAGARLQLESARDRVADAAAGRMIDAAGRAVAEAVADVRRLTEDLRPPALDELGLTGSLRALAARTSTPDRPVTTDLAAVPPLPAALEVALHRIAGEALTNAARHAGATTLHLRLQVAPRALVLEVTDDGGGLAPGHRPGVGLESMRQRAEELGGRLELDAGPGGGTTVRAVLPHESGPLPTQRTGHERTGSAR